jgi:hypothetical protein
VAGDTHGNERWIATLAKLASRYGCDGVVQLGDFGFWPDQRALRSTRTAVINDRWLDAVAETLARRGVWMRVLDGNHDFHPDAAYPAGADGIAPIRDGVLDWATRGARWEWCGVRFGALGGAVSTDREYRVAGQSWWDDEAITDDEVERLGSGPLDVLLAHDAPQGVNVAGVDVWPTVTVAGVSESRDDPGSMANRGRVERARQRTAPALLLHGHYHLRYSRPMLHPGTGIEGLAADVQANGSAWGILDLPAVAFADGLKLQADGQRRSAQQRS